MGLGDMSSTILVRYKGDTKQLRGEMKKLRGEEKKRHKEMLEEMEKQNSKIDDQIAMWGKVAIGVGGAIAAYKSLSAGFDEYVKKSQLQSATAGADIGRLQKAVGGLASEMDLLRFAQNAMTGDFKLTQAQMEQVLRGSQALAAQGHDLTQVLERVGQAVREGNVEPLKEYGIVMDTTMNDTMEGAIAIADRMGQKWEEIGGKADFAGKSTKQAQVALSDAFSDLKVSVGRLGEELVPVMKLLAEMVGLLSEAIGGLAIVTDTVFNTRSGKGYEQRQGAALAGMLSDAKYGGTFAGRVGAAGGAGAIRDWLLNPNMPRRGQGGGSGPYTGSYQGEIKSQFYSPEVIKEMERLNRKPGRGGGSTGRSAAELDAFFGDVEGDSRVTALLASQDARRASFDQRLRNPGSASRGAVFERQVQLAGDEARAVSEQIARDLKWADVGGRVDERNSILTQIFGEPEQIDLQTKSIQALGMAFDALTGAAGAAMDAWITGSQSATEAAKQFIAESLRSIAVQMTVEAAKHGAMALGSLAIGGPLGGLSAAQHGAAAAAFAGVAATAGIAAKGMGAGGGAAARGAPPPSSSSVSGLGGDGARLAAGGEAGNQTTFILLDDGFDALPARARENQIRRRIKQAGITIDSGVVERR